LGALGGAALALGLTKLQLLLLGPNVSGWALCLLPLALGAVAGGLALSRLVRGRRPKIHTVCMHCHAVNTDPSQSQAPEAWLPSDRYLARALGAEVSHGLCPFCLVERYGEHLPPPRA
jgi:cytochrome c553